MRLILQPILCLFLIAAAAFSSAQLDLLNFETAIGSFKMIKGKGTASFSFEGTVLLIDVVGDVKMEGQLKKEFDDPKLKRKCYFGKGKITVVGSWRGIQWFGGQMKGFIKGESIVRIAGEFDKNLDTGFYWYGTDVAKRNPWYSTGLTITVPQDPRLVPKPIRRGGYGG